MIFRFVVTKNGSITHFFHLSLLLLFLDKGFDIRDPGWIKIRIRDKHPTSATLLGPTGFMSAIVNCVGTQLLQLYEVARDL
jgi:hypothetical protein